MRWTAQGTSTSCLPVISCLVNHLSECIIESRLVYSARVWLFRRAQLFFRWIWERLLLPAFWLSSFSCIERLGKRFLWSFFQRDTMILWLGQFSWNFHHVYLNARRSMNEMISLLVSYAMIFQSQIRPAKPYSVIFILFILFYFKENISGWTAPFLH